MSTNQTPDSGEALRASETSDGRPIEVEFVSNVYKVSEQRVVECNIRDITERKRAEQAAARLAEDGGILLNTIQTQIWYLTHEDTYGAVNKAHAEFNGLKIEDMAFKNMYDIFPRDVVEVCRQSNVEVFTTGKPVRSEEWVPHVSGERRLISILKSPKLRADGSVEYVVCAAEDITERKQAEEAMRESEAYQSQILQTTADGFWVVDNKGRVVEVNNAYCVMTGYTQEEILGMGINDLDAEETPEATRARIERIIRNGFETFETRHRRKDGSVFSVDISTSYIKERGGQFVCFCRDITERKRAEAALVASEERYRLIVDHSSDLIWILKPDGVFSYISPSWKLVLGYEPSFMEGMAFQPLVHPEDVQSCEDYLREVIDVRTSLPGIQYRAKHADGSWRWHEGTISPVYADDGALMHLVGVSRDITERKRAEDALRENQSRYQIAQSIGRVGNWEYNLNTGLLWGSDEAKRIFGTDPAIDTFSIETVESCIPERDRVHQALMDLIEKDAEYNLEYQIFPFNSKQPKTIASLAELRKDDKGLPMMVSGVIQDITERKRAETYREMRREILQILNEPGNWHESIQRVIAVLKSGTGFDAVGLRLQEGEDFPYFAQDGFSKDFLLTENTLLERGKDGGVCRDKDGNVCLECTCGLVISGQTDPSNPLFTKGGSCWTNDASFLLELPRDQDPRRHPRNNCIHQNYASVALIPLRIPNQKHSRETCIRNGFLSIAHVPVQTSERIVGLIQLNDKHQGRFTLETIEILEGIAAHIGSALMRKQSEEERERLQAELNQAQKMEAIGRLAGGVAHDFNNQLMGIMGFADICRDEIAADHPIREWLDEITLGVKRSADLTRQLLAFARKQTIEPKVLDLNEAVAGSLKMLHRLIREDIDLLWKPGAELWPVKLDPGQADQILANLCVNARDAIVGVGKVTIETQNVTIDMDYCKEQAEAGIGPHVMLAVSDDGCGMDKETLAHIFEPFYTTKGVGEGYGLGLSTVYGIVKQNAGFANVYSEPGKGTTFRVYLPRFVGEDSGQAEAHQAGKLVGGTETILLVEDEKGVLVITARFLEKLGYNVLSADCPDEALRMAAEHEGAIELLITDVVMPGMNGREVAAKLTEEYPRMKSMFISGYTADVIAQRGVVDEGVQFLAKPFTRDDLACKVREVLC